LIALLSAETIPGFPHFIERKHLIEAVIKKSEISTEIGLTRDITTRILTWRRRRTWRQCRIRRVRTSNFAGGGRDSIGGAVWNQGEELGLERHRFLRKQRRMTDERPGEVPL
jgi:hypothetical protein